MAHQRSLNQLKLIWKIWTCLDPPISFCKTRRQRKFANGNLMRVPAAIKDFMLREMKKTILALRERLRQDRCEPNVFGTQFNRFSITDKPERVQRGFPNDDVLGAIRDNAEA